MAKITDYKATTHKVYLPSTANAENEDDRVWVEFKDQLQLSDKVGAASGRNVGDSVVNGLSSLIVAWNYTEDGTPNTPMIPITAELIDKVINDPQDVKLVMEEYYKAVQNTKHLSTEEKKTSLGTSPQPAVVSPPQI